MRMAKKKAQKKASLPMETFMGQKQNTAVKSSLPVFLPMGQLAPQGWVSSKANNNEFLFKVSGDKGQIGSASLTVVAEATGATVSKGRRKTIGGVSTTDLRRTVIDRMIQENGWVENDYQKEIGGKEVYVVIAKSTDAANQVQSRTFYFTEVDGRIYSLATKARKEESEKLAKQSEKVLETLQGSGKKVQQAKKKE
jgi:hypothetical protein